jgi:multiple sugar transport system substrate-binding protein
MPASRFMKGITISLTGIMLVGGLAACSTSNSGSKVSLRMIESLTSPERTQILQGMITEFEKENPKIKVELISPPFDQADNKIRTMLGAKQDLDVLEARDINIAEYTNNNYLEPLDSFAASWDDYKTVMDTAKSVGSTNDKLYFVANAMYRRQVFYRKDYFDAKGISAPKTWEELYEAAKKLTDPAQNRYGFSFRGGAGAAANIDRMIYDYNADNADFNDSPFTKDGKSLYSTPETVKAAELYKKIYKETSPPDSVNWGFTDQVQAFTSGVTAILLQDPDAIQALKDKMDPNILGSAMMVVGPTGKGLELTGAGGWAIPAYSKHKEEAWKLISYLSGTKQNTEFAKKFSTIPIHTTASSDPFFQTGPFKTLLDMTADAKTYLNYTPPIKYPGYGSWDGAMMKSSQAWLLDKMSTEDMLKEFDKYWMDQKASLKK